jgi:nucleoside-diphosphate-sugar epimerase
VVASWIHEEDAARALLAAAVIERPGSVFNIADDEPVIFRDFIGRLASETGTPQPVRLPAWLVRIATPLLYADLASNIPASNAKAKRELG